MKLAISVDSDVHADVLRAARAQHQSISAWMTTAARRFLAVSDGLAAVAEWEKEHGELSERELLVARARVAAQSTRSRVQQRGKASR